MIRVAALYDIHGNLPALEAVLGELDHDRDPVDTIVCGGDVLAGPHQTECIALLRDRGARCLAGNSEREVLAGTGGRNPWWLAQLTSADQAVVGAWPQQLLLETAHGRTLFCHASPRSDEEIITVLTPEATIAEALAGVEAATVVIGHTHAQFDRTVGGVRLLNAGSVGRPYEGRPGAFWALLGTDVELRCTEYDVEAAVQRMRTSGMPGLEDELPESLLEPMARDEVAAIFERQAGRALSQPSVSVSQKASPANSR